MEDSMQAFGMFTVSVAMKMMVSCCCPQSHPKFSTVEDLEPLLYSKALQKDTSKQPKAMTLKEAVRQRIIANETLAYFIGRTYLFLVRP
jgi:glycyl-tRNA synthetase (class II)